MVDIKFAANLKLKLEGIAKNLNNAKRVEIGFPEGATYPDGTPVALVAALNEFGVPAHGQPPRPFFRNMIAEQTPKLPEQATSLLKSNDYDMHKTLGQLGEAVKGELIKSITELMTPPLAASTVAKKGGTPTSAKPLIDTGHMLNSIVSQVDE